MSARVVCPSCGYRNSSHRITCKSCRSSLADVATVSPPVSEASQLAADTPPLSKDELRAVAVRNMVVGGLWCVGGIVVTAVSYSSAEPGGTYIITWGAVLFGAIQFLKGFFQLLRTAFR